MVTYCRELKEHDPGCCTPLPNPLTPRHFPHITMKISQHNSYSAAGKCAKTYRRISGSGLLSKVSARRRLARQSFARRSLRSIVKNGRLSLRENRRRRGLSVKAGRAKVRYFLLATVPRNFAECKWKDNIDAEYSLERAVGSRRHTP